MKLEQHLNRLKGNKVGIAVLGVGLLAVIAVLILAVQTFSTPSLDRRAEHIDKSALLNFKGGAGPSQKAQPQKPKFERQKSITESQIVGNWDAPLDGGRALLQLNKGAYRLVIIMDDPSRERRYSNGTYKLTNDLLLMTPNMKWGAPDSKQYSYRLLTRSEMPVIVSKYNGKLVWQMPGNDVDVYVPNYHPFLALTKDRLAVWQVLK